MFVGNQRCKKIHFVSETELKVIGSGLVVLQGGQVP